MTLPVVTQSGPAQQLYVAGFSILQLLSLVLLASHTAYNVRATPIWGCEAPSLPDGAVHVVVSTFNAEADQLLPWIWHLGLTNAHIYIYYRVNDPAIPPRFKKVTLPCGMALLPTLLLPNKGREAASFLQHIITHYSNLPKAMMLVHDHGPASRHSLCGPFYRRVRGYYRGLVEQHASSARTTRKQLALPSAARDGSAVASRGSNGSTTGNTGSVFSRFASMAVTLSSGCMENWAKGCCAMYICSGTVSSCPFTTETCTSNLPGRTFYLHTRPALYDSRYENQIIGYNGSNFPVSMVRYASTSSAFSSMWNISHEYPDGEMEHSKAHTLQVRY